MSRTLKTTLLIALTFSTTLILTGCPHRGGASSPHGGSVSASTIESAAGIKSSS